MMNRKGSSNPDLFKRALHQSKAAMSHFFEKGTFLYIWSITNSDASHSKLTPITHTNGCPLIQQFRFRFKLMLYCKEMLVWGVLIKRKSRL